MKLPVLTRSVLTSLLLSAAVWITAACNGHNHNYTDRVETNTDTSQEIPAEKCGDVPDDAPASQLEALTEEESNDSTDMPDNLTHTDNYIYISKPQMRLFVLTPSDSVIFTCKIACGLKRGNKHERNDYRTPEGVFSISGMYDSEDWLHETKDGRKVKGCYGPYFLRLRTGRFTGIGIHGTNAPRSIGRRASEGCIRVNSDNIITLRKEYAYEGMTVVVSAERERMPRFKGWNGKKLVATTNEKEEVLTTALPDSTATSQPATATDSVPAVSEAQPVISH